MQYKKLIEIAKVQGGLVLSRKKARFNTKQCVAYIKLNLRSINSDGSINEALLDRYLAHERIEEQFITTKDDIVMCLFPPFRPAFITESLVGLVVPSQFAIIRLGSDDIVPEFLWRYLSHSDMLGSLAVRASGQATGGIKISTLAQVKIPLLPLVAQQNIAAYGNMHMKRKQLYLNLIAQYDLQFDAVINEVIGGKQYVNHQKRY